MKIKEKVERKGLPGGPNEMVTRLRSIKTTYYSTDGYKRNSPDKNRPYNIIPSGNITMKDVDFPVLGIDDLGNQQMMMPGADYIFPGSAVLELPIAQEGGNIKPSYEQYRTIRMWWDQLSLAQKEDIHQRMIYPKERNILSQGDKLYKERFYSENKIPAVTITGKPPQESNNLRVAAQNKNIIENETKDKNYAIIDKAANTITYYDINNKLIKTEPVITGTDNKDKDYSISMRDWYKDKTNKGKTHDDYFDFLKETQGKVTPSGHFTIASHRTDVNKNPGSFLSKRYNDLTDIGRGRPIGTRNKDIVDSRTRDYGDGNMFTLKSDAGLYSSKAIHGTGNPVRIDAFNAKGLPNTRDLSNGCINVNGKTICFDTLEEGSSVYILPEEGNDLVQRDDRVAYGKRIYNSKQRIYNSLESAGKDVSEDALNFISAVHGKETRHGDDRALPFEDRLPRVFKSTGEFQINPRSFRKYLPENYTGSFDDQVSAVYNFYEANKDKYNPSELYSIYNSGRVDENSKTVPAFNNIYKRTKRVYQPGGEYSMQDQYEQRLIEEGIDPNSPYAQGINLPVVDVVPFDRRLSRLQNLGNPFSALRYRRREGEYPTNVDRQFLNTEEGRRVYGDALGYDAISGMVNPFNVFADMRANSLSADAVYNNQVLNEDVKNRKLQDLNINQTINAASSGFFPVSKFGKLTSKLKEIKTLNKNSKKIELPKVEFKSEIDWSKWNKEIPENKPLMDEYLAIEQQAKADGTWMKNPDGSDFVGSKPTQKDIIDNPMTSNDLTPEEAIKMQFIQQRSQNLKNAFGKNKVMNPDGSQVIYSHGSPKRFEIFDENMFGLGDPGYSGRGIYTAPNLTGSSSYELSTAQFHKGEINPTTYRLYGKTENPIRTQDLLDGQDLMDFNRKNPIGVPIDSKYDVAIRTQRGGIRIAPDHQSYETVFPNSNSVKSAIGNNGMFDMTNPNIYKALLPASIMAQQYVNRNNNQQYSYGGATNALAKLKAIKSKMK